MDGHLDYGWIMVSSAGRDRGVKETHLVFTVA